MYHEDHGYVFSYDFIQDQVKLGETNPTKSDMNGIIFEHKRFLHGYDGLFGLGMSGLQNNKMYDLLKVNQLEEQFSLYLTSNGQSFLYGGDFDKLVVKKKTAAHTVKSADSDQWLFGLKTLSFEATVLPLVKDQQAKISLKSAKIEIPQDAFDEFVKKLEKLFFQPI
jgi:hypothetical protein